MIREHLNKVNEEKEEMSGLIRSCAQDVRELEDDLGKSNVHK